MNYKSIKFGFIIFTAIILLIIVFVIADYFSLFGVTTKTRLDFIETRVRTVDAETGGLVVEVGVRCLQKNNNNACTRRKSYKAGVVSIHVPVQRVIEKSFLFNQHESLIKSSDSKIHMMFIHKDYHNTTITMLMEDIYSHKKIEHTVKMTPRVWNAPGEEQNE